MSIEELSGLVTYDPDTGSMVWRAVRRRCGKAKVGKAVGSRGKGRVETTFAGRTYGLHQIAWFIMTGEQPSRGMDIDHINGDSCDNRFCNLRRCTHAENCRNASAKGRGLKGVYRYSGRKKPYWAYIMKDRKRISIGYFATEHEAARAYDQAAGTHFGEFARPNFPQEIAQ